MMEIITLVLVIYEITSYRRVFLKTDGTPERAIKDLSQIFESVSTLPISSPLRHLWKNCVEIVAFQGGIGREPTLLKRFKGPYIPKKQLLWALLSSSDNLADDSALGARLRVVLDNGYQEFLRFTLLHYKAHFEDRARSVTLRAPHLSSNNLLD